MGDRKSPCVGCRNYIITYDRKMPYGCRVFQFQSRKSPHLVVYEASGKTCPFYAKRAGKKSPRGL
ncbi:MAG: uracil-DNA glycosylase [Deltaproteobacteria bacterium]|nr:MAG: uracil-DNA glycosylase [Deltaproteobacteria bacterium]